MKIKVVGATGSHIRNALEHVATEQEPDSELVTASTTMIVEVVTPKPALAMKVHAQPGPIGVIGKNALKNVTVEFKHEHDNAKMGKRVIAQVLHWTSNNAIDSLANAK